MRCRRLLAVLIGASLPLLWSTAALAHAVLRPGNAPAGNATEFQVLIPHGCSEGEPPPPPGSVVVSTRLVSVLIPDGVEVNGMSDAPGFSSEQTPETLTWSGGDLESEDVGEFFFTATLSGEDGEVLTFDVYQECDDELNYRWSGTDASTPAPTLVIGDEAAGHDHDMEGMTDGEMADGDMNDGDMNDGDMAESGDHDMAEDGDHDMAEDGDHDMAEDGDHDMAEDGDHDMAEVGDHDMEGMDDDDMPDDMADDDMADDDMADDDMADDEMAEGGGDADTLETSGSGGASAATGVAVGGLAIAAAGATVVFARRKGF